MKFTEKLSSFNEKMGTILSDGLSSMQMFYIVTFCVVCPLLVERPNSLISWIQYLSTAILQAVALPLLGFTTKKSGDAQEKIIKESHMILIDEFKEIKETHDIILIEIQERSAHIEKQILIKEQIDEIFNYIKNIK